MNSSSNATWRDSPAETPGLSGGLVDAPCDGIKVTVVDAESAQVAAGELPLTIIEPRSGWQLVNLGELWRHRELLWILAARDVTVRYKQTLVGAAWALLQPAAMIGIFSVLFGLLGRTPADQGVPYALSVLCGLLPWQLFANALTQSTGSLVQNQHLLTKVYFPRVILPIVPILCGLVDFAIALGLLAGMLVWYGIVPGWPVLLLPAFLLLTALTTLALGLWLSALNVLYRDIGYVVPFALQIGFFVSPVVYEENSLIPPAWRAVYALNPLAGIIQGFRWSLLGTAPPAPLELLISLGAVSLLLVGGLLFFRRTERFFADRV